MTDKLYRFCTAALGIIAIVLTAGICLMNLLFITDVTYDGYEWVSVSSHVIQSIIMLFNLGCISIVASYFRRFLERTDERKLYAVLAILYSIMAGYLILNVDPLLRADAKHVWEAALDSRAGVFTEFQKGNYIYSYPHQLGLLAYESLLSGLSENPKLLFFVNFLMVLGINRTCWKISDFLFHDKMTNVLTILMCFGFLPQLFFILFAYGLIPGFFFLLLGFYYALRYVEKMSAKDLALMAVCVGAAVLLKQNYLIGAIAVLIFLFLQGLKRKNPRILAAMLVLVVGITVPGKCLRFYYEQKADVKLDNGSPSILWAAMGSDIDNNLIGPGWYDHSSMVIYNSVDCDAAAASSLGMQKMADNIEKIIKNPGEAVYFFARKTASQWCDPLHQSIWSGPQEHSGQYTHTELLKSIYNGKNAEIIISWFMKLLGIGLWCLAAGFLLFSRKNKNGWDLMYLYFIGGLLFHTIWEGKSQYTYTYLFVLIPFAAWAGSALVKKISGKLTIL